MQRESDQILDLTRAHLKDAQESQNTAKKHWLASERWRDLLLAEHLALTTLDEAGVPAARTRIIDHDGQRFLEVERFDRVGRLGRRALHSLAALEAESSARPPSAGPT